MYILIGSIIYLLYTTANSYYKEYPLEQKRRKEREEKNKYIPHKKHKRKNKK